MLHEDGIIFPSDIIGIQRGNTSNKTLITVWTTDSTDKTITILVDWGDEIIDKKIS